MSQGGTETERLRLAAWNKSARNRGLRWRILRDLVAVCSLRWMTTSAVQDVMMHLHGLTHQKCLTMLGELERPGSIKQERDEKDQIFKWGSTPRGVTYWIGSPSGGVWKTTNNGVTWEPIFDDQGTSTIGDVTVSPSNPDIIWVGTGEPNNRQSSSWGDGVYKSTDAGKTWKNIGLRDTHHIGRIVIHPTNPDIIYVAALSMSQP